MTTAARPLIAVIDYGIGNLRSAQKSLERVGADARLTDDVALIATADGVVLPGVGAFGACMDALRARGLDGPTVAAARSGRPFLGICVGMQMLYAGSEESPGVAGLGVLAGTVRHMTGPVKLPQMQWNQVELVRPSPLFAGLGAGAWFYFVHSYAAEATDDVVAVCDYGGPVVAAAAHGAVHAVQFHPEKSGPDGLALLANFVALVAGEAGTAVTVDRAGAGGPERG